MIKGWGYLSLNCICWIDENQQMQLFLIISQKKTSLTQIVLSTWDAPNIIQHCNEGVDEDRMAEAIRIGKLNLVFTSQRGKHILLNHYVPLIPISFYLYSSSTFFSCIRIFSISLVITICIFTSNFDSYLRLKALKLKVRESLTLIFVED